MSDIPDPPEHVGLPVPLSALVHQYWAYSADPDQMPLDIKQHLIRVFTVCLRIFDQKLKKKKKKKIKPNTPKFKNGIFKLIRMGKFTQIIWVIPL